MHHIITALENTRARLIVSETRTSDALISEAVIAQLKARGFIVLYRTEGQPKFREV